MPIKSVFVLFIVMMLYSSLSLAQPLARAPLLGIGPANSDDIVIGHIAANSTANALGLKQGDQLLSLNGIPIEQFDQLVELVQTMKVGTALNLNIVRNNATMSLTGTMQPRPYETSPTAHVSYEQVEFDGHRLRTIVHTPSTLRADQQAPAIFYIQGYTCGSIDMGMAPQSSLSQLVNQFTKAGYVVFRVEKPGVGDSQSPVHCSEIDFTSESAAFTQALGALKARSNVDPKKVYIWGHSLGVLHSVVAAHQEPVAGIIGYGGVFKPWYDYLLDIFSKQSVRHFSVSTDQAKSNTRRVQPFLDLWLNSDKPWSEVLTAEVSEEAIESELLPLNNEQIFHRHYSFFRDLNQYNFAALWQQSRVPVLMIHGSLDIQAIDQQWAFDIVKTNGLEDSSAIVIDGAEHSLLRYDSSQAYRAAQQQGRFNPMAANEHFDPRIAEQTLAWLRGLKQHKHEMEYSL